MPVCRGSEWKEDRGREERDGKDSERKSGKFKEGHKVENWPKENLRVEKELPWNH